MPWFLPFIFGGEAPSDSMINVVTELTPETLPATLSKQPIPYSYLRLHVKPIPDEAKAIIAKYAPLDTGNVFFPPKFSNFFLLLFNYFFVNFFLIFLFYFTFIFIILFI